MTLCARAASWSINLARTRSHPFWMSLRLLESMKFCANVFIRNSRSNSSISLSQDRFLALFAVMHNFFHFASRPDHDLIPLQPATTPASRPDPCPACQSPRPMPSLPVAQTMNSPTATSTLPLASKPASCPDPLTHPFRGMYSVISVPTIPRFLC